MAKLGDIDYTNLDKGAVAPSQGREISRGVSMGLGALGDMWQRKVEKDLEDDARDVIEEAHTAAVQNDREVGLDDLGSLAQGEDKDSKDIWIRLNKLDAVRRKGDSRVQALATLELKNLVDKYSIDHPKLARQLQQKFGQVVGNSAKLYEIGLIEDYNVNAAKQASEEYNDFIDWAYTPVANHGLGIPRTIRPNTAEFANLVSKKSKDYALNQSHELTVATAAASADMSARTKSTLFNSALSDYGNAVSAMHREHEGALLQYRQEMAKPVGQRNELWIEEFQNNQAEAITEAYAIKNTELKAALDQMFPTVEEKNSQYYKDSLAVVENTIKQSEAVIQALTSVSDDASPVDRAIAVQQIQHMAWVRSNDWMEQFNMLVNPSGVGAFLPFMETIAKYDVTGHGAQVLGGFATNLSKLYEDNLKNRGIPPEARAGTIAADAFVNGGGGQVGPTDSPDEIKRKLQKNMRGGNKSHLFEGSLDEDDDIKTALAHLGMMGKAMVLADESDSPATLNQFLLQGANGFMAMSMLGNPHPDAVNEALGVIGHPSFVRGMDMVADPAAAGPRIAMATAAEEFLVSSKPAQRREQQQQRWNQPIWKGYPPNHLVQIFTGNGDNPELEYNINRDIVRSVLEAENLTEPMPVPISDGRVTDEMAYIDKQVRPLVNEINRDIRATAHLDAIGKQQFNKEDIDYILAADQLGWIDFFMGE